MSELTDDVGPTLEDELERLENENHLLRNLVVVMYAKGAMTGSAEQHWALPLWNDLKGYWPDLRNVTWETAAQANEWLGDHPVEKLS